MVLNAGNILLVGAVLLFVSILAGKAGSKFGVPVLLLFLGVGMVFGSDGLGIQFNSPTIAQFIGMIALSVILFSGGMDTKFKEIRPVLAHPDAVPAAARDNRKRAVRKRHGKIRRGEGERAAHVGTRQRDAPHRNGEHRTGVAPLGRAEPFGRRVGQRRAV